MSPQCGTLTLLLDPRGSSPKWARGEYDLLQILLSSFGADPAVEEEEEEEEDLEVDLELDILNP